MRHTLAAALVTTLSCSGAPPPAAPQPSATPASIDLDREDCARAATGLLTTRWGSFWFEGTREEGASRVDARPVLVSLRDEPEAPVAPWYGTLIPLADSAFGVCVRSYHPHRGARTDALPPDALVKVDARTLRPEVVYSSGHRLLLVGRITGGILLAELGRDGHELLIVDANGHEVARSRPVVFPPGVLDERATELPLRVAAPLDRARVALLGDGDRVLVAEVRGQTIELRNTGAPAERGLALRDGALVLQRRGNRCNAPGSLPPPRWRFKAATVCPREGLVTQSEGLAVDGALVRGVRGEASRCQVRSSVSLPPRQGDAGGSGVTVVSDRSVAGQRLDMELLVRGRRLSVQFNYTGGESSLMVEDGFGVALPPGAVTAQEAQLDGASMLRVHLRAEVPLRAPPVCLQGRWTVRAWTDEGQAEDVSATRYDEFGRCE